MDSTATITILSDECQKCKYVDICDGKRMMACMVMSHPFNTEKATAQLTMSNVKPIANKYTPITINMGECGKIDTSLEQIKEQAEKALYKSLSCRLRKTFFHT